MLRELGIQWVPASGPQAKGRIERLFGALQDRLVAELRLAGITDQAAANAFLPGFLARYNARFAQPAAQPELAYRPWPQGLDPDTVFCFKYLRTVSNDNTITLEQRVIQILPDAHRTSYAKARVEVHERLDGISPSSIRDVASPPHPEDAGAGCAKPDPGTQQCSRAPDAREITASTTNCQRAYVHAKAGPSVEAIRLAREAASAQGGTAADIFTEQISGQNH